MVAYACCAGQPKEARKASTNWFDHKPGKANDTEMLLWALLIWHSGHYTASELKTWAKAALRERPQAEALEDAQDAAAAGKPPS
jgi:hypothetical protein